MYTVDSRHPTICGNCFRLRNNKVRAEKKKETVGANKFRAFRSHKEQEAPEETHVMVVKQCRPVAEEGHAWQGLLRSAQPSIREHFCRTGQGSGGNGMTTTVWQVYEESDMTEGRGPMRPWGTAYGSEQAAWDACNELPGVMGRHPRDFGGNWGKNWQEYKQRNRHAAEYDVRPLRVEMPVNKTIVNHQLDDILSLTAESVPSPPKAGG
jgi:hypothetical protein